MRFCLLLALLSAFPAEAGIGHWCVRGLLHVRAHFLPISYGPQATFENVKAGLGKIVAKLPFDVTRESSTDDFGVTYAHLLRPRLVARLQGKSRERQVLVLGRLLDAPGADRRTGIAGWLDAGVGGAPIRARFADAALRASFVKTLRAEVVVLLAAIDTVDAWRAIAWGFTTGDLELIADLMARFREFELASNTKELGLASAIDDMETVVTYLDADRLALEATQKGAPATIAATTKWNEASAGLGIARLLLAE